MGVQRARTLYETLARAKDPVNVTKEKERDPAFEMNRSFKIFCQAFMRGSCPNGTDCYLAHPPVDNIAAAIDELQQHGFLSGSVNKHWCEGRLEKVKRQSSGASCREICIKFIGDRCQYGDDCRHGHFLPWILSRIVEPETSPFVTRSDKGKSRATVTKTVTSTPRPKSPVIVGLAEEPDIIYESVPVGTRKVEKPPSPLPIPTTYDESSASSSDLSGSEFSDSASFRALGHSPTSGAPVLFEEPAQHLPYIPRSHIPDRLCRDFYRYGKCGRGADCRYDHERPPAHVLDSLLAASTSSKPPTSLNHPHLERPILPSPVPSVSPTVCLPPSQNHTSFPSTPATVGPPSLSAQTLLERISNPFSSSRVRRPPISASPLSARSTDEPPSSHVPQDVCPQFFRNGSCKTRGCLFIHSLPDPPRLDQRSKIECDSLVGQASRVCLPNALGTSNLGRFDPGASNSLPHILPRVPRASPYVCHYWSNNRICPRRPCPYSHGTPMTAAPIPLSLAAVSLEARVNVRGAPGVAERPRDTTGTLFPPAAIPCRNAPFHLPPYAQPGTVKENTQTSAVTSDADRLSLFGSLTPLPNPNAHAPPLLSRMIPRAVQTPAERAGAPPGLQTHVKPAVEEYSTEGLFTPDQAKPTAKFVSDNTDRFLKENPSLPVAKSTQAVRRRGPSYPAEMQLTINNFIKTTMGPGFVILNVVTPNETCWITVGHLPVTTTKDTLARVFGSFGGTVADVMIPEVSDKDSAMSVRVQMGSHSQAMMVADSLDGVTAMHSDRPLTVRPSLPRAVGKSQISDSEVKISWRLPTINLYAGFDTLKAARKAVAAADGYDWDGYWVTSSIYEGFPVVGEFNVRFSGLPPNVKHKLVRQRFECGARCEFNTDRPSQTLQQFGIPQVEKRVAEFGHVVDFHVTPAPYKDGVIRAWCLFESSDVASIARELNGIPQRCLNNERLTVRRIHSVRYPISRNVYGFISAEVHALREATWRFRPGTNIRIFDHDHWQDRVKVDISSEESHTLQEVKARLVDMVQGEVIMDGNVPLWDRFFYSNFGSDWMNTLRVANPTVLVIIRKIQSYIRVVGAPEKRKLVIAEIRKHVAALRGQPVHCIPLSGTQFGLFMHPALLAVRQKYGSDNLWLDIEHRRLCVRADESVYEDVQAAVHAAIKTHPQHVAHDRCPVCLDIPTTPVVLSCGDVYCKGCLANYLAAGTETREFPLTCFGADGKCKEPIPLVVARDVLQPGQWDQLVAVAFNAHVATRLNEFRFCPTPDCSQVYRPGAKESVYNCPACLIRICPYCDVEYHEGITCNDRARHIDSSFDEYARTHEVKRCPGCKAPIERAEGCNHMTCTRCHTHTCWECMQTFDKGTGIYDHMREEHGSIGV